MGGCPRRFSPPFNALENGRSEKREATSAFPSRNARPHEVMTEHHSFALTYTRYCFVISNSGLLCWRRQSVLQRMSLLRLRCLAWKEKRRRQRVMIAVSKDISQAQTKSRDSRYVSCDKKGKNRW